MGRKKSIFAEIGREFEQARRKAAREAAKVAMKELHKYAYEHFNVKIGAFKKAFNVRYTFHRSTVKVTIKAVTDKPFPLGGYARAKQTEEGVSVPVRKGQKPELHKHAFIAKMKSGHKGIFVRKGKSRLPIKEKWGPNPVDILEEEETLRRLENVFFDAFSKEFDKQMDKW